MAWKDQHSTVPAPTKVGAYLGTPSFGHAFRFNPSSAEWSYNNTMYSQDTIGGRVVQILSTNIEALTIQGFAGSRNEIQRMAINMREIMQFHIDTLRPVDFKVPSRNWNFKVYVEAMPQVGWDVASTSYPYTLQLRILEDISGAKTSQIKTKTLSALTQLNEGIGYIPGVHGGNADRFVSITDVLAKNLMNAGNLSGLDAESAANTEASSTNATPAIKEIQQAVYIQFPDIHSAGVYDCRTTAGGGFSQHSAGNGWDVSFPGGLGISQANFEYLDRVYNWLKANMMGRGLNLPISQVIWRDRCSLGSSCNGSTISGHQNHMHISGSPYLTTPAPGCNP